MITIVSTLTLLLSFRVRSRTSLELELVARRHQVTVLRRRLWCKRQKRGIFAGNSSLEEANLHADDLFKGHHFDPEIIILWVRWDLSFKVNFRDLVEMMAERGFCLAHTTIMRWIARYVPEFEMPDGVVVTQAFA